MIRDRIFDDFQKFQRRIRSFDGEFVQKLHHKTSETRKSPGDPGLRIDFNQNVVGSVDINL